MLSILIHFPSYVKIRIAYYLRENAVSMNRCNSRTSNLIKQLMFRLLEDEDPMVFQESLDSLNDIIHMSQDEDFVTTLVAAVGKKASIKNCLESYLTNRRYYKLRGFSSLTDYLKDLTKDSQILSTHCCDDEEDDGCKRDSKILKLETGVDCNENSQEFQKRVDEVCDGLNYLVERKSNIERESLEKLRFAFVKIFS